ncbi:MAG: response regulator transcription factor [Clostridiales bacterium]|nr:response regulator transcription factor [Clostridiales bacterium]
METPARILIVEDDARIARFVALELEHEGYRVLTARDGPGGLEAALRESPDLVLLDLMLPGLSGIEVCRRIRRASDVPVIMLTARDEVTDKVQGLDVGADDYLTKPFHIEELLARIRAALRRQNADAPRAGTTLSRGQLTLDQGERCVRWNGTPVELTRREYELLRYMLMNKNSALSRERILTEVWGFEYVGETNVVDVYISYLRRKIDERFGETVIETIRGYGYTIREEERSDGQSR